MCRQEMFGAVWLTRLEMQIGLLLLSFLLFAFFAGELPAAVQHNSATPLAPWRSTQSLRVLGGLMHLWWLSRYSRRHRQWWWCWCSLLIHFVVGPVPFVGLSFVMNVVNWSVMPSSERVNEWVSGVINLIKVNQKQANERKTERTAATSNNSNYNNNDTRLHRWQPTISVGKQ